MEEPVIEPRIITLNDQFKETINRIVKRGMVEQIHLKTGGIGIDQFYELIILVFNNCTRVVNELDPLTAMVLIDSPQIRYRLYPMHQVKLGVKRGYLSFLDICLRSQAIYTSPESNFSLCSSKIDVKAAVVAARNDFKEEINKIQIFKDGADFYLMKENYCHAAFMVHQVIELSYRCLELSIIGRDKITHSIRQLQGRIRPFIPELGNLFDEENERENNLLSVFDNAYIAVRYGDKYQINKEQLIILFQKAKKVQQITMKAHEEFCSAFEQQHIQDYCEGNRFLINILGALYGGKSFHRI